SNDITRLQALVDRKKVVITEAAIRDVLRLDDAAGVDCLPNEEIFAKLARMGYEKPSIKLTFYKAFFSSQWKEGKGFSWVEMPLFEGMLVVEEPEEQGDAEEQVQDNVDDVAQGADTTVSGDDEGLDACAALTRRVEHLEHDKLAHALELTKLKKRVKKLERVNKVKVLKLRRLKKVVAAVSESVTTASATTATIPATTITAAPVRVTDASTRRRKGVVIRDLKEESTAIIPAKTMSMEKSKGIMVEEPKPIKKQQQVEMDEEYARKLHEELNKDIEWNVAIDHVKQKAKEDSYVQRYQSKEQIEEEENREIMSINETIAQKAAKRRKLNEEVEDLKQHLEIMPDEDDDVYTEATPLARKVPVVDYEIPNNFSDDYMLTTLGAIFERPNGQAQVWKNQRTVHGQARVKSWKLLELCGVHIISFTTTQLILLVERRYPLSRITLDQMLNAVRLIEEEQSEMSLELLRFTRQQYQKGQHE
nr:hypothetical protein [Tanacetum cinerariifolium]